MTWERALAHPLRRQLFEEFRARDASPVELAKQLDLPLGVVSYHVRVLAQAGLLELHSRTYVRGAVQHHYRARDLPLVAQKLKLDPARAERLFADVEALLDEARSEGESERGVEFTAVVHRASTP